MAARYGIAVFLDPIETGGWLGVLGQNGVAKDRAYGRFLGRRYAHFKNIIWWNGNDFESWQNKSDDADTLAVARGIRSTDPHALQTVELNYPSSGSLDDTRWRSVIRLDGAYTYFATYAKVLAEYERKKFMPVYMQEAGYEFEQNASWISPGTPEVLRRQEYWSALSGAAGQFYGNHYTWQFATGWQRHLDTTGSKQLGYLVTVARAVAMVPARTGHPTPRRHERLRRRTTERQCRLERLRHGGRYAERAAGARVSSGRRDGVGEHGTASRGRVRVRWFDPTNGRFRGPALRRPNHGVAASSRPRENSAGDHDWLLVLTAA